MIGCIVQYDIETGNSLCIWDFLAGTGTICRNKNLDALFRVSIELVIPSGQGSSMRSACWERLKSPLVV